MPTTISFGAFQRDARRRPCHILFIILNSTEFTAVYVKTLLCVLVTGERYQQLNIRWTSFLPK